MRCLAGTRTQCQLLDHLSHRFYIIVFEHTFNMDSIQDTMIEIQSENEANIQGQQRNSSIYIYNQRRVVSYMYYHVYFWIRHWCKRLSYSCFGEVVLYRTLQEQDQRQRRMEMYIRYTNHR